MKISLNEFAGTAPKIEPRRLADKMATAAVNAAFDSGALGPVAIGTQPSPLFPSLPSDTRSILRPANSNTRLAFSMETTGDAFPSLVTPLDRWGRIYFTTATGPRYTTTDNYSEGELNINPASYRLGMPTPTLQPVVAEPSYTVPVGTVADLVFVAYVFTYVDKYGHESAPSAPSTKVELPYNLEFSCQLSFSSEPLPDTNLSGAVRRIYRSTFDGSTSAWQFLADVPLSNATWTDTIPLGEEAEELVSTDWVPPPVLEQMVPVASNYVAGFHSNYLCYSALRLPHAWPEDYRYPLKYQIVGLKPTQNGLLVATTGKPYWAFGADPASAVPVELDANHPCLSAKSMVDMGGFVIYASYDGLIAVDGQDVRVVSEDWIDRATWLRDFSPADIVAFAHENHYVFSVGDQWWAFDPINGMGFTTLGGLSVTPAQLRQAFYDIQRDTTVLLASTGKAFDVVSIDEATTEFFWRSKPFEVPPVAFSTARVLATQYPVTLEVTTGDRTGEKVQVYEVQDERPVRLAPGYGSRWQIGLGGRGRVTNVTLCQSPLELK